MAATSPNTHPGETGRGFLKQMLRTTWAGVLLVFGIYLPFAIAQAANVFSRWREVRRHEKKVRNSKRAGND